MQLGKEHEKSKDSSDFLNKLAMEAVNFQKTMNQLQKGGKIERPNIQVRHFTDQNHKFPELFNWNVMFLFQIHTPTPPQVLETLNMINGIVFVHVR